MTESTRRRSAREAGRPPKPYADFPLSPHASGTWQKKIRGKVHYFGRWGRVVNGRMERIVGDGWEAALEAYKTVADDLHAGRTPRVNRDGLTVADLCNRFLTAKLRKVEAGELGQRMFTDYKEITDLVVVSFEAKRLVEDLAADDFSALRATMAKSWGPVRLGNAVGRVRSVFKFGIDNGLIDRAVRFGTEFKKPGRSVLRRYRAKAGEKMLESEQLRRLLEVLEGKEVTTGRVDDDGRPETICQKPNPTMRAMVLLGLNCGFGNSDVATLPLAALDMVSGWVNYPRPKTGIGRRCPLWPETVAALRLAIAARPEPNGDAEHGLAFLSLRGRALVKTMENGRSDSVGVGFGELLRRIGMHKPAVSFYSLRHVHRTVADAARDSVAADLIMGHADPSMGGHYRERIDDDRLVAVANVVRTWLFPPTANLAQPQAAAS